jgi:uncharacterized protein
MGTFIDRVMLPISTQPKKALRQGRNENVNEASIPQPPERHPTSLGSAGDSPKLFLPMEIRDLAVCTRTAASACAPPRPKRVPVECGDLPFVIRRDGTWMYRGSPIGRKELVCLFSSVLKREADGSFWLETPAERGRIVVEDAPFVAVEMDWTGDGQQQSLSFRTNVDQIVAAGPEHPIRVSHDLLTCEPTPYILVRPGAGHLAIEARIGRAVYYELVALAVPEWVDGRQMLGVWSQGHFFSLGELPDIED